jgi:alpha-D-ribose 1-methylphosphonate 5-triphosphate synthase subunit PhnG
MMDRMAPGPNSPDVEPSEAGAPVARQHWMAVLARAETAEIAALLDTCPPPIPPWRLLRGPESGLVMVRGRAGGGGAAFNLGEMTVTRCTVRTDEGQVGHAYIAGRDREKAKLAALVDALLLQPDRTAILRQNVIMPLERKQRASRETTARKAAATRVQFFTLASMRT